MAEGISKGDSVPKAPHPYVKVFGPMILSVIALGMSLTAWQTAQGALEEQHRQGEVQRQQRDTQESQLATQGEQLDTQRRDLEAAELRWIADGPVLVVEGYLRQDPDEAVHVLNFVNSANELPIEADESTIDEVRLDNLSETDGPLYLELQVTNTGRSDGSILRISGSMFGFEESMPGEQISPCKTIGVVTIIPLPRSLDGSGSSIPSPTPTPISTPSLSPSDQERACPRSFERADVACLNATGQESDCAFPVQVTTEDVVRVRVPLTGYLEQPLKCEGPLRASVDVQVVSNSGASLSTKIWAANEAGCPQQANGIYIAVPEPLPFR